MSEVLQRASRKLITPHASKRYEIGLVVAHARIEPLAPPAPPCFESRDEWLGWLTSAVVADEEGVRPLKRSANGELQFDPTINFCGDCSTRYRARMKAHGKCKPEWLEGGK